MGNPYVSDSTLDTFLVWVSSFGVPIMVLGVAGQWWVSKGRQHTRHILLAAGSSFLFGLALNQVILLFVHRVRPYDAGLTNLLVAPSVDPSLPSDHAIASFAISATFLVSSFHGASRFLAAAILISVSGVYKGTHYVSDVAGGVLTGLMAAAMVWWIDREDTRVDRFMTGIL